MTSNALMDYTFQENIFLATIMFPTMQEPRSVTHMSVAAISVNINRRKMLQISRNFGWRPVVPWVEFRDDSCLRAHASHHKVPEEVVSGRNLAWQSLELCPCKLIRLQGIRNK